MFGRVLEYSKGEHSQMSDHRHSHGTERQQVHLQYKRVLEYLSRYGIR